MKRKIFLDFTSLLDIIMIILFFFLINFKFSVDGIKAEADRQAESVQNQIALLDEEKQQLEEEKQKFEEEKEEWQRLAESELEKIRETDEKAADNAQALIDFKNGHFISVDLEISKGNVWKITVRRGETVVGTISSADSPDITDEFVTILNRERFKKDDVIIGVFSYNKKSYGSYRVAGIFKELKEAEYNFTNLYLAEAAYTADVL